ncbi:hypothetical protein [Arthrobacter sp. 24S4-2]|uniref:hypothetical protein n=1 Tax=Arthrobacter sp. 24S4-2 TaxID=2575374 RepID=UPI001C2FDD19|nr:hypothetical protein [Arthrobacter sp. 24S4-2]
MTTHEFEVGILSVAVLHLPTIFRLKLSGSGAREKGDTVRSHPLPSWSNLIIEQYVSQRMPR